MSVNVRVSLHPIVFEGCFLSTSVHTYNYTSWAGISQVILLAELQVALIKSTMSCLVKVLTWATTIQYGGLPVQEILIPQLAQVPNPILKVSL